MLEYIIYMTYKIEYKILFTHYINHVGICKIKENTIKDEKIKISNFISKFS